ncbi:LOW QUALITY PROTEIN: uncharacterized protein [Drosophila tropicalis]|uniref:LOW QUALITY PROTEIN: uncharacterized protein n=1 Tax=Drosophila tropicalis TaxID=46794 RepID=UPI0035ABBD7F
MFCEHCCGESQQHHHHQQQQQQQRQQEQCQQRQQVGSSQASAMAQRQQLPFGDYGAFYREHTDSVSDLSSFRFVLNEEESNSIFNTRVVASTNDVHNADDNVNGDDYDDDDDDVDIAISHTPQSPSPRSLIEIEKRQPKSSKATPKATQQQDSALKAANETSHASSPVSSIICDVSPTICCYTIDKIPQPSADPSPDPTQQQQQQQQQHQLSRSPSLVSSEPVIPLQHYQTSAIVSYRPYIPNTYRRYPPPPVPPKPPRSCVEVTASCGFYDAEPALKTRRLGLHHHHQQQQQQQPYPLHSNRAHLLTPCAYGHDSSCCDSTTVISKKSNNKSYHVFEGNNNNYNCKFSATTKPRTTTTSDTTPRSLIYDRHGRLKQDNLIINPCDSEPETLLRHRRQTNEPVVVVVRKSQSETRLDEPQLNQVNPTTYVNSILSLHNQKCNQNQNRNQFGATQQATNYIVNESNFVCNCNPHVYACSAGLNLEKENTMEKRRNTLDRFQRLGFGRKSSPAASSSSSAASGTEKQRKTSERSERLKELTELLRGGSTSRASSTPTPPPVPPPRKPRGLHLTNSLERQDTNTSQTSIGSSSAGVQDQLLTASEATSREPKSSGSGSQLQKQKSNGGGSGHTPSTATRIFASLKPNTSLSNLEAFLLSNREKSKSPPPPPLSTAATRTAAASSSCDWNPHVSRPESRTVSGSYAQTKGIPFRSVSFSQIDCKSTLSALRDRLRRDKAVEAPSPSPTHSLHMPKDNDDPGWIHIPLKKTELCINLNYGQEKSLEHVLEDVNDSIQEEDIFNTDNSSSSNLILPLAATASSVIAAHATMESLTDTIQSESDCIIKEEPLPIIVQPKLEITPPPASAGSDSVSLNSSAPNLATLMEEQVTLESPPGNFLQTATTCEIPVPVYECAAQEWLETPAQEWVEVAPEEFGIVPETIQPPISHAACKISQTEPLTTALHSDLVPTISISVTHSSEEGDELGRIERSPSPVVEVAKTAQNTRRQASEPEHCKQYSHDDLDLTNLELRHSMDTIATPRHSTDERHKRHLDKSTKRKGMYIDNADWHAPAPSRGLALDISVANLNAIKSDSPDGATQMYINSPATDEMRTPGFNSFELNTPELEKGSPSWSGGPRDKSQLLSSFSCQSSEEKDDASSNGGHKSYSFSRTDSISDNECERMARERITSSPTPSGDYDYKRFSKRPLRGPYGQMLEAEMKKPNRMHFEEILEELRETDSVHSRRQRGDEATPTGSAAGVGNTRTNMPQYSNSMRVRKSNTYLPVPSHARAASTPSQIEHISKSMTPSSPMSVSERNLKEAAAAASTPATSTSTSVSSKSQQLHHMKRAASEAPAPKSHHNKRSQSMSNERGSNQHPHQHQHHHHHHHHGAKRNLDANATGGNNNNNKSKASGDLKPTPALLAELLKGSSENMISEQRQKTIADTRTYVVQEIYRNEQSYVESLQTVVLKYLKVLKAPEHAGMIDTRTVDEIFFMVPDILEIHEKFLGELKQRLDDWDIQQKVGDAFMDTFSKLEVLEVYTSFVNNCNRAKNAIRSMKHQRPSFAKFLESTAREHKGKLTLDNLLIKPVQKFPNYELLFQRLIKHTDHDHPDQKHLQDVLKLVHDILVHINCKEREIMENGQREATLRELEGVIEGITDLISPERQFLLFDLVSMPSGQGARKDRGFFLFNDLLVLTSIKKRSGTIRKPNSSICPGTVATTLDTNKYKFLTKISLDCLEIVKSKDENIKRIVSEIESLADDCGKLQQITDITVSLRYPHQYLEDVIRELHRDVQRQLSERQSNDTQLNMLELTVSSPSGNQKLTVVFNKTEKRTQWEETFNEAKQKLAATLERHPIPEFLTSIPIRKTRAGLQFTCAAATLSDNRDVWVCNSDGYVGQVCIMSLHPEPNVTSCNGVCNARILCVASVPAYSAGASNRRSGSAGDQSGAAHDDAKDTKGSKHGHSYTQQLRDYRKSISPSFQPASATATPEKKKTPTPAANDGTETSATNTSTTATTNTTSDTQLELNLSSSDDEPDAAGTAATLNSGNVPVERVPSPAPSMHAPYHAHQESNPEEGECNQSTMWIGTEDGCIHVYNSTDNIRIKKNRIKIEHHSAVYSILYLDNRVFVSLANGDICVYLRDGATSWNTCSSHCLSIGTVTSPVTKLLNVDGKLWCSIQGIIKVLDVDTLTVINQIQISSDSKPITNMTVSNNYVWISIQNSAHIKCFHSNTHQQITEVNLAPAVNKMLSNCDEIIRQHKAACLRVTSLLCCKDLIWIGTSAGVLLTIPAQGYEKGALNVVPTGIPHGHTGHVRFLTFVETTGLEGSANSSSSSSSAAAAATGREAAGSGSGTTSDEYTKQGSIKHSKSKSETNNTLIISGGDGYEDFRNSGANSLSEIAGREDSTNHLLIWQI